MKVCKKKPCKWVAMTRAHRWKNDKQSLEGKMITEEQRNQKTIKIMNKREILGQLTSYCPNFLEDGLMWDGVESIYKVYLKHHLFSMGIQSGSNIMDRGPTTFFNHHPKLIWWTSKKQIDTKSHA
jgi:hypothetical protein